MWNDKFLSLGAMAGEYLKEIINQMLEILEEKIRSRDFKEESNIKEWEGADVVISEKMTPSLKKWIDNSLILIKTQDYSPHKRVVITKCSKELSWLFYQLKDTFKDDIDYLSKYDFYAFLAQNAIDFIEERNKYKCEELLLYVLNAVRGRWNELA